MSINNLDILILISFFISCGIQLIYWVSIFSRISKVSLPGDLADSSFVTVIVVFKNEKDNLKRLIPALLGQEYPSFELLFVNDFSNDDFQQVFEPYLPLNNIRLIHASKDFPGKKLALREGVKEALGEIILVTDADCLPFSPFWIKHMSAQYNKNIVCVL